MLFKTLTCILVLVVVAEGGYIFLHRRPINRFKPVEDDGYAAFDTATGQLCKTFRARPSPKGVQYSPSASQTPETRSGDLILDMIQNGPSNAQGGEKARIEFIRGLPTCADIR
jgi:hypothetical protein